MRTAVNHCKVQQHRGLHLLTSLAAQRYPSVSAGVGHTLEWTRSIRGSCDNADQSMCKEPASSSSTSHKQAINGSASPPAVAYHNLGVCLLEMEALDDAMSSLARAVSHV